MKEKEQSSIEWLFDKWCDYPLEIGKATFRRYLLIAKEKHKKEIIEANMSARLEVSNSILQKKTIIGKSEQYYTEKYGQ